MSRWCLARRRRESARCRPATDDNAARRYDAEVRRTRELVAGAALTDVARLGGRFTDPEQAPPPARILFHLLQEYARHVGQLDVARELIDGVTGE